MSPLLKFETMGVPGACWCPTQIFWYISGTVVRIIMMSLFKKMIYVRCGPPSWLSHIIDNKNRLSMNLKKSIAWPSD